MGTVHAVELCQRAQVLIGAEPMSSFEDGTREATVAAALYESEAQAALTAYPWRFAIGQKQLNRLVTVPVSRWDAAYQLPSDCLLLRAITVLDAPIPYDRYSDSLVYCDAGATDIVVADYILRADESRWSPLFRQALMLDLAARFAAAVAEDAAKAELFAVQAQALWSRARTQDGQAQTAKSGLRSRLIRHRRG